MMILNAYTIFDNKALQYHPPFYASTDAAACRAFQDLANDSTSNVGRHPADYILYCCGTFLDSTARLEAISPLRHVADAISLLAIHKHPDLFQGVEPDHEVHTSNHSTNGSKL